MNRAAERLYGYTREEFRGLRLGDVRPRDEVPPAPSEGPPDERGAGGRVTRHRLRDGGLVEVRVFSQALPIAGRRAVFVRVENLTERSRAEDALRQSEERYRRLVEHSPDGVAIHSEGKLVFANAAALRLVGATDPSQVLGRPVTDFVHPDSRETVRERIDRLRLGEPLPLIEERFLRLDGRTIEVEVGAIPFRHAGREASQVIVRDVTARKRAERLQAALYRIAQVTSAAQDMEAFFASVHAIVGELMCARNFYVALRDEAAGDVRIAYFADECDVAPARLEPGRTLTAHVLRTGEPLLASPAVFADLLARGEVESVGQPSVDWLGVPLKRGDRTFGAVVVQSYTEQVRFGEAEKELLTFVARHLAAAIDRKSAADALRESETRFRTVAETAPCAIFIYQGTRFVYANPAMSRISGYDRGRILAMDFWDLVHPEDRQEVRDRGLARQRGEPVPSRYEFRIVRRDGAVRWVDLSAGTVEHAGRPAGLGVAFDITERRQAEEQVHALAYHDVLTGLPNRLLFGDRLQVATAQAHRGGGRLAVLFLDLDRFKVINDSLGHGVGDRVLQGVAERLQGCVREGDTVARLGGDEFTVILPGIRRAVDAVRAAEKVREALRQPFRLDGCDLFVTASVGVSVYPEDGTDAETLLRNADSAMYRAKEQGRDNCQVYASSMNVSARERLHLEGALRRAVAEGELTVHYQPQLDPGSGEVAGVEALLRWEDPERGTVLPAGFLALAEATGLVLPLGARVLRSACTEGRRWRERGHPALRVAVNLSARELQQPELVARVQAVLRDSGLEPGALELEVGEGSVAPDVETAARTLGRLRDLGVRIALDGFGAGRSSLADLRRLPADALKIDRSLVRGVASEARDEAVVSALVALAHTLGLEVVAVGVESTAQRDFLAGRGCDRVQGFLVSPALPPDECSAFLTRSRRQG